MLLETVTKPHLTAEWLAPKLQGKFVQYAMDGEEWDENLQPFMHQFHITK